ncbi:MAG: CPBP family intramembrane metalloprotease, partial [Planctomycetia bacterium]|nr:CPBP family intramembrane metalloprotease [Planctomycetia bacterium]
TLIRPYGLRGRDALGFTTRGAGRSVWEGSTAYLLLVGPCVVLLWLTVLIMDSFELKPVLPAVFSEIADQPWWVFALAVARLGIVVPFFEEFFFRGVIQGTMMRAVSPRQAIFLASMVFALAHIGQPQGIPSIFLLSLGLGYVYCRCRSLVAPFVLHSLFNIGFLAMKWTDS